MQNDFPAARRSAESERHKDPCDTINQHITDDLLASMKGDLLASMKGEYVAATQDEFPRRGFVRRE